MTAIETWHYWVIAALALGALEMFFGEFLFAGLGVGCLGAAAFGGDTSDQLLAFCLSSVVVLAAVRPFAKRWLYRSCGDVRSNVDALRGVSGTVVEPLAPGGIGRVQIGAEEWRAETEDDGRIDSGEPVVIKGVSGATVTVSRAGSVTSLTTKGESKE